MRKILSFLKYFILGLLSIIVIGIIYFYASYGIQSSNNMDKAGPRAAGLIDHGVAFRDLNKNGELDTYEDPGSSIELRVENLLSQMTLEEKAGMMFVAPIMMNNDGSLMERPDPSNPMTFMAPPNSELLLNRKLNSFNVYMIPEPREMAIWYNNIQRLAERTRLGIPVTIASDPRHSFSDNPATSMFAGDFSLWPEPLGLAAMNDAAAVQEFAEIARTELHSVGIRLTLHPVADLATEPRWGRINHTFGEDAELSAQLLRNYIRGLQGESLNAESVAAMTKHFPGGGPQKDGEDPHFPYGREQIYPGDNFDYHLIPFEKGAFPAKTAQIMPYYGIAMGQTSEDVAFAFNKEIITGMLREKYGFDGVVCADWGIITQKKMFGIIDFMEPASWGVEHLSDEQQIKKAIDAGVDQFGGEMVPHLIVNLVQNGEIAESRIDESVRRILRDKFRLGLFNNPYIDPETALLTVGRDDFVAAGKLAQRKSLVLLKNAETATGKALPLNGKPKIYIENIDPAAAGKYGEVVANLNDADVAILRLKTPYQPKENANFLESMFRTGDLDFKSPEKERILTILESKPTIVDIYLERPAVIPEIAEKAAGLIANFGANDEAVLDVVFGKFDPQGKLPMELPSSMEAVRNQKEDVPFDSKDPLFPFGFGLSYDFIARTAQ